MAQKDIKFNGVFEEQPYNEKQIDVLEYTNPEEAEKLKEAKRKEAEDQNKTTPETNQEVLSKDTDYLLKIVTEEEIVEHYMALEEGLDNYLEYITEDINSIIEMEIGSIKEQLEDKRPTLSTHYVKNGQVYVEVNNITRWLYRVYNAVLNGIVKNYKEEYEAILETIYKVIDTHPYTYGTLKDIVGHPLPAHSRKISTRIPNDKLYLTDKTSREVFKNELALNETHDLGIYNNVRPVKVKLTLSNTSEFFNWEQFTHYDRLVYEAIASIYDAIVDDDSYLEQDVKITYASIFKVMVGDPEGDPRSHLEKIHASINKLNNTVLTFNNKSMVQDQNAKIDNTKKKNSFKKVAVINKTRSILYGEVFTLTYEDSGLEYGYISVPANKPPFLYQIADSLDQVQRTPLEFFNSPLNKNETNLYLQDYLIKRIQNMINGAKTEKGNIILWDTIYSNVFEEKVTPNQKKRLREYAQKILDHLCGKGNEKIERPLIKSYRYVKEGNKVHAIKIELFKK